MTASSSPSAVLWDMDGTIVDTEPYWIAAETELVESFGGAWTQEDALALVGSGLWEGARVLQTFGVALEADEIVARLTARVREQLAESGIPWQPGAQELLRELRARGIRTALVTMSVRSMAQDIVDAMGFDAFELLVTGDAVTHAKPHPDPYLTAARGLGLDPGDCLALEDSPTGIASAMSAGVPAIGVPHAVDIPAAAATVVWPTLAGRTVDDLVAVFAAARKDRGE